MYFSKNLVINYQDYKLHINMKMLICINYTWPGNSLAKNVIHNS
jgi:hypothetical protein